MSFFVKRQTLHRLNQQSPHRRIGGVSRGWITGMGMGTTDIIRPSSDEDGMTPERMITRILDEQNIHDNILTDEQQMGIMTEAMKRKLQQLKRRLGGEACMTQNRRSGGDRVGERYVPIDIDLPVFQPHQSYKRDTIVRYPQTMGPEEKGYPNATYCLFQATHDLISGEILQTMDGWARVTCASLQEVQRLKQIQTLQDFIDHPELHGSLEYNKYGEVESFQKALRFLRQLQSGTQVSAVERDELIRRVKQVEKEYVDSVKAYLRNRLPSKIPQKDTEDSSVALVPLSHVSSPSSSSLSSLSTSDLPPLNSSIVEEISERREGQTPTISAAQTLPATTPQPTVWNPRLLMAWLHLLLFQRRMTARKQMGLSGGETGPDVKTSTGATTAVKPEPTSSTSKQQPSGWLQCEEQVMDLCRQVCIKVWDAEDVKPRLKGLTMSKVKFLHDEIEAAAIQILETVMRTCVNAKLFRDKFGAEFLSVKAIHRLIVNLMINPEKTELQFVVNKKMILKTNNTECLRQFFRVRSEYYGEDKLVPKSPPEMAKMKEYYPMLKECLEEYEKNQTQSRKGGREEGGFTATTTTTTTMTGGFTTTDSAEHVVLIEDLRRLVMNPAYSSADIDKRLQAVYLEEVITPGEFRELSQLSQTIVRDEDRRGGNGGEVDRCYDDAKTIVVVKKGGVNSIPLWKENTTYDIGELVRWGYKQRCAIYRSTRLHNSRPGRPPPLSKRWVRIQACPSSRRVIHGGKSGKAPKYPLWFDNTTYEAGRLVRWGSEARAIYRSTETHDSQPDQPPPLSKFWIRVKSCPPVSRMAPYAYGGTSSSSLSGGASLLLERESDELDRMIENRDIPYADVKARIDEYTPSKLDPIAARGKLLMARQIRGISATPAPAPAAKKLTLPRKEGVTKSPTPPPARPPPPKSSPVPITPPVSTPTKVEYLSYDHPSYDKDPIERIVKDRSLTNSQKLMQLKALNQTKLQADVDEKIRSGQWSPEKQEAIQYLVTTAVDMRVPFMWYKILVDVAKCKGIITTPWEQDRFTDNGRFQRMSVDELSSGGLLFGGVGTEAEKTIDDSRSAGSAYKTKSDRRADEQLHKQLFCTPNEIVRHAYRRKNGSFVRATCVNKVISEATHQRGGSDDSDGNGVTHVEPKKTATAGGSQTQILTQSPSQKLIDRLCRTFGSDIVVVN